MNDTAILDWIERHVTNIRVSSEVTITWLKQGKERETVGKDLRDAVRKANVMTAAYRRNRTCPACGDDRAGKGSLIYGKQFFLQRGMF